MLSTAKMSVLAAVLVVGLSSAGVAHKVKPESLIT
jgi:hypothetical protein